MAVEAMGKLVMVGVFPLADGILTLTLNSTQNITVFPDTDITGIYVESRPFDGKTSAQKFIDGIIVDIDNRGEHTNLMFDIKWGDTLKGLDSAEWESFDISSSDFMCNPRITGKYFKIRVRDLSPTVRWKLTAIAFFGQLLKGRQAWGA